MSEVKSSDLFDRIKGMLYGVFIGDALGIPFEFGNVRPKIAYSNIINDEVLTVKFQFATKTLPTISDDSEKTITLLRNLINNNFKFDRNSLIMDYMEWANSGCMLGVHTRELFKGIKTLRGYEGRIAKLTEEQKNSAQSNGSLMSVSPLVLLGANVGVLDTQLTNPNIVNTQCTTVYLEMLKLVIKAKTKVEIREYLSDLTKTQLHENVITLLQDALNGNNTRYIGKPFKGWVCHSLYIAINAFLNHNTYLDAMVFIIKDNPGSDTDTNGAIAGALFGANTGFSGLLQNTDMKTNIEKIDKYFETTQRLYKLTPEFWKILEEKLKNISLD
jgi:ADP-ribosyl-[dinitrogen reductase] hydrolase